MKTIKELTEIKRNQDDSVNHYRIINGRNVKTDTYKDFLKMNEDELFDFCRKNNGHLELGLKIGIYLCELRAAVSTNAFLETGLFSHVSNYDTQTLECMLELESFILNEMKNYEKTM